MEPLALTAREFELLAFLMRHPERAFRREELLEKVWGYAFGDTSTVRPGCPARGAAVVVDRGGGHGDRLRFAHRDGEP